MQDCPKCGHSWNVFKRLQRFLLTQNAGVEQVGWEAAQVMAEALERIDCATAYDMDEVKRYLTDVKRKLEGFV
jgi:hypothetical protein